MTTSASCRRPCCFGYLRDRDVRPSVKSLRCSHHPPSRMHFNETLPLRADFVPAPQQADAWARFKSCAFWQFIMDENQEWMNLKNDLYQTYKSKSINLDSVCWNIILQSTQVDDSLWAFIVYLFVCSSWRWGFYALVLVQTEPTMLEFELINV